MLSKTSQIKRNAYCQFPMKKKNPQTAKLKLYCLGIHTQIAKLYIKQSKNVTTIMFNREVISKVG